MVAAAGALGWLVMKRSQGSDRIGGVRAGFVWLLQTAMAALLLFLIWHPALSVATLKPQQNIVAVVVDDSASMGIADEGSSTRKDAELRVLNSGLVKKLQEKFQVRLYSMSDHLQRIEKLEQITGQAPVTHVGESLKQVVEDAASLPIGAVVLLSDGADTLGGIDLDTISEIRRQRIPVHTIGFGKEKMSHDIEVTDVELTPRALPDSVVGGDGPLSSAWVSGAEGPINMKQDGKVLASQEVTLKGDGVEQVEQVLFSGSGGREDDCGFDRSSGE